MWNMKSWRKALGATVLATTLVMSNVGAAHAGIIESVTNSISQASGREVSSGASMSDVSSPSRSGTGFKHVVQRSGERSELRMRKTVIGGTYWYGWSMYIPSNWQDTTEHFDIFSQFATYPSPRNGKFDCGANGTYMVRNGSNIVFKFQRKGASDDTDCTKYNILTIPEVRGKWVDFVMHVKWTGNTDGFLKLYSKVGDGEYVQKVNHTGRTFWNDETDGPYFKMGLYKGDPNFSGPAPREMYTDEYRLGDSNSSFDEVKPR